MPYSTFFAVCVEEYTCQLPCSCPRIPTMCLNMLSFITKVKFNSGRCLINKPLYWSLPQSMSSLTILPFRFSPHPTWGEWPSCVGQSCLLGLTHSWDVKIELFPKYQNFIKFLIPGNHVPLEASEPMEKTYCCCQISSKR